MCREKFKCKSRKWRKVKHHCHFTGKYRHAVQSICSFRYAISRENPVVMHNGSKYEFFLNY